MALSRCLCFVLSRQTAASRWVTVLQLRSTVRSNGGANLAKVTEECCHFGSVLFILYYLTASCLENITMQHEVFGLHQWWQLRHLLLWGTMNVVYHIVFKIIVDALRLEKYLSCQRPYDMNRVFLFYFSYLSKGMKILFNMRLRKL